jgi:hypothetical protein
VIFELQAVLLRVFSDQMSGRTAERPELTR